MSKKITIKEVMAAVDLRSLDLWESLDEDERKDISLYIMLRYCSSIASNNKDIQEYAVQATNHFYNKHFFTLSKHPELLWKLACITGINNNKTYFHEWIGHKKKKESDNSNINLLKRCFPTYKQDELELLSKINTTKEINEYAKLAGINET